MNQRQSTGYLFAFGASLALAASFVFRKSQMVGILTTLIGIFSGNTDSNRICIPIAEINSGYENLADHMG